MTVHIYAPEPMGVSYRVLPWLCRNFTRAPYEDWRQAFEAGIDECPQGFRVFRQTTYEWHEPLHQEIIRVRPEMKT